MKQYKDTPYFVDTEGNVYRNGKKLKPKITTKNYHNVYFSINGVKKHYFIHRLVAELYIPNPENKSQINHLNGNRTDNRVENLEWATALENNLHKINVLGRSRGIDINTAKLTEELVKQIRFHYNTGNYSQREIAKKYKVSQSTIGKIVRNESWKHI